MNITLNPDGSAQIDIPADQWKAITDRAKKQGMTASGLVWALLMEAQVEPPTIDDIPF